MYCNYALLVAASSIAFAQAPGPLAEVQAADTACWKAFSDCDYAMLDRLTTEKVEFHHAIGGVTNYRAALTDSVRMNIRGRPAKPLQLSWLSGDPAMRRVYVPIEPGPRHPAGASERALARKVAD